MPNLALLDLIAPYVLRGENLGSRHAALSVLRVVSWESAADNFGIVLRGVCEFNGYARIDLDRGGLNIDAGVDEGAPAYDPNRRAPVFDIRETAVEFELFVPRAGSQIIAAGAASIGAASFAATRNVLDVWDALPLDPDPTDYPTSGFTLDLILKAPLLRPPFLHPARLDPQGMLMPDPSVRDVAITLPKLRFRLTHGNALLSQLRFDLVSAGASSLDDPGDIGVAELISMQPPYAFIGGRHDRVLGIGFRSAALDLSNDSTPPAVLQKCGVGDDWTGLYLPEVRVFIAPEGARDFAFEAGVNELLIGFGDHDGIWGDFEAALVNQGSGQLKLSARFFDASGRVYGIDRVDETHANARIPANTRMVVDVTGGRTPYLRQVKIGDGDVQSGMVFNIDLSAISPQDITVTVSDSSATSVNATLTIHAERHVSTPVLETPRDVPAPALIATLSAPADTPKIVIASQNADEVLVTTDPADTTIRWRIDSGPETGPQTSVAIPLAPGQTRTVHARKPGAAVPSSLDFFFYFDEPQPVSPANEANDLASYGTVGDNLSTQRAVSKVDRRREGLHRDPIVAYGPSFDLVPPSSAIRIRGEASYEGRDQETYRRYNYLLARRRALVVRERIKAAFGSKNFNLDDISPIDPTPDKSAIDAWVASSNWHDHAAPNDRDWWKARVELPPGLSTADDEAEGTLNRPNAPPVPTIEVKDPPVSSPEAPDWFRSAKLKVRIVRSVLIAAEIDAEIDFHTAAERKLRDSGQLGANSPPRGRTLQNGAPIGPDNPADGITRFRVLCQSDPATGRTTTLMAVGADPADKDGLACWGWLPGETPPESKDDGLTLLGSYLSFWPLLVSAAEGGRGAIVNAVLTEAALAIPFAIAAMEWFQVERVIVFGGEYLQSSRGDELEGNLLFDIGVAWTFDILDLIKVEKDHPLFIRYKAIGLRFGNRADDGTPQFMLRPIFDSSRGYTIDVAKGGALKIKEPLGQILRVLGARLSRTNPLTFEVDVGLGVDLGVVSVDRASVRVYLDGSKPPELTALAAHVDIPGALVGSGYMQIGRGTDGEGREISTIGGQIDLTLRPLSVRVSASIEVATIPPDAGGPATGVYVGLNVVLPVGLPLGNSGLGIFGFRGIFGMHYERNATIGAGSGAPALEWLSAAQGKPHLLVNPDTQVKLWIPHVDRWAFGLGMLIGTMEGGVIMNLDGTLLLELPGPRVLIMMNARIISPPPSLEQLGSSGGILAVIEITPQHFLIGVLAQWQIPHLIRIVIPVEALFPFSPDSSKWHIYLGARRDLGQPVEVDVLGIVRGTGYLMFKGDGLPAYKVHNAELPEIKGFGIGLGVAASFIWGNTDIGLYLRVGGGMDAVLGLDPLVLAGTIYVSGELRLFIVSVGAHAQLTVKVNEQPNRDLAVYIHGEACGRVSFFFFDIEGCVDITIQGPSPAAPMPALVEKVAIKSRSPALLAGTGVDRGIDTSLGNALQQDSKPDFNDGRLVVVPIDAIPVISMRIPPVAVDGLKVGGLETAVVTAPGVRNDGFVERGGEKYRYELTGIALERIDPASGAVLTPAVQGTAAPVVWWTLQDATGSNAVAQLALFTWEPSPATKAIEKTDRLEKTIRERWGRACDPAAPATEVLWTFRDERMGPSSAGWELNGIAWPDPPGTLRSSAPDTTLHVSERWRSGDESLDAMRGILPALVVDQYLFPAPQDVARGLPSLIQHGPLVLQAPMFDDGRPVVFGDIGKQAEVEQRLKELGVTWGPLDNVVVLHTGPFVHLDLLLYVELAILDRQDLVVRVLDAHRQQIFERRASPSDAVPPKSLPPRWTDSTGPWYAPILDVRNATGEGVPLRRVYLRLPEARSADRVEIGIVHRQSPRTAGVIVFPSYLVAAVGKLSFAEVRRHEWDEEQIERDRQTITNVLGPESSKNALLFSNSLYRLTATWSGKRKSDGASRGAETQTFWFKTDRIQGDHDEPPKPVFASTPPLPVRLDPWMLVTLPADYEADWFGGEKVRLVFNTHDIDRVFAAYGKELRVRFQASSGRHPPGEGGSSHPFRINASTLVPMRASILSPWEEAATVALAGSCIPVDEDRQRHSLVDIPIPLEPFTGYILDVEMVDLDAPAAATGPSIYRRHFSTGGFATLAGFAASLQAPRPTARACEPGAFEAIRAFFNGRQPMGAELDDQFLSHGLEPPTVPERARIVVFWSQQASALPQPEAVLIDATEPLWRSRPYPSKVTDDTAPEPAQRWVLADTEWLTLDDRSHESPGNGGVSVVAAGGIIRAPGAQRALIVLKANMRGKTLRIDLVSKAFPALPFLSQAEQRATVIELPLDRAPWEEN